jgi:redox-sensitive bicupin YhaK (pirin superfamily)
MGTGSIIKPGDIQRMSAGTGVEHSEYNPSTTEAVHFLQIWIIPEKRGLQSAYEQKAISQSHNQFILIGSRTGENGAITIHQDVELYAAYLTRDAVIQHTFQNKRRGWLQLIHGKINLNGQVLSAGDGAAIIDDMTVSVTCLEDAELLLFDLV